MGPSLHLWFLHAKLRLYDQNYKSLWVPGIICCFFCCIQNSVIMTRINSLYESQTSPVVVCMQNSAFSTRFASLNGSQPSSDDFPGKTATFGSELQVSMGPRLHLSFCVCKTAWLAPVSMDNRPHLSLCECKTVWLSAETLVSMGPRPHLSFCACKTTRIALELLVSMGPSPHLWFLHAKQRH